jgi:asparaginyl-tRNA synthetase
VIEPEVAFADLADNASLAEALVKCTFAALLNERQEDLAFFDERIKKGLVAKLEGIVGSEFAHMDYGEAIRVLSGRRRNSSSRSSGASTCSRRELMNGRR